MLIKLHAKCAVNPINVAAVKCGKLSVGVMLTNGRTHNIECRGANCDAMSQMILTQIAMHVDMIEVGAKDRTWINVDHVLSIAEIASGIAINMAGDFVINILAGMSSKPLHFDKLIRQLEAFK